MSEPFLSAEPRALACEAAAAFCGLTVSEFRSAVRRGDLPRPMEIVGVEVWHIERLRTAIDALTGWPEGAGAVDGSRQTSPALAHEILTVRETAERMRLSTRTIYGLISSEKLGAIKRPGSPIRVPVSAIEEYERRYMQEASPAPQREGRHEYAAKKARESVRRRRLREAARSKART